MINANVIKTNPKIMSNRADRARFIITSLSVFNFNDIQSSAIILTMDKRTWKYIKKDINNI